MRKHLCLLTTNIIALHTQRVIKGITAQCAKYDYDLSVFSIKEELNYYEQILIEGSINIYNLPNFDKFDAVIVDSLNFITDMSILNGIFARIKKECHVPVITISTPYEDYPVIEGQNESVLRAMCCHMVEEHGYSKFCILTGPKDNDESIIRLNVFLDELDKHGITVPEDYRIYGDFWYSSGEQLADRIASGELAKPDAVICASDHMGLGLINQLIRKGLRVPEDIAVIGFEGTLVAKLNPISLASFDSNDVETAALAVDFLRAELEPDKEIIPFTADTKQQFCKGSSCGCKVESRDFVKQMGPYIYNTDTNFSENAEEVYSNIGVLLDSYSYEDLFSATDIESCMEKIVSTSFFVQPYKTIYLCLRENWTDLSSDIREGYPERMKLVVQKNLDGHVEISSDRNGRVFDTSEMLPQLFEEFDTPSVFYFTAVHFNGVVLGYSVVQTEITQKPIDIVYKNWLRFVCSCLEMTRVKNTYMTMSIRDAMTGLYNRRGMYKQLETMLAELDDTKSVYVAVIDMDGLKYINDTFGHMDGDICLIQLGNIIAKFKDTNEIAVRAGGDEFYIIGVGEYSDDAISKKEEHFIDMVAKEGVFPHKKYILSASIGSALWRHEKPLDIEELIAQADEIMYHFKVRRKKNR